MQKAMNDQPIQPGEGILHHAEGVDLIPANIELAGMEVAFVNSMNREKMLKRVLDNAKREYDYILLDCTPSLGMLTVNALAAADTTLIPMQAQYLSAKGLEQLLQTIGKVRRQINPKLKIEGILLTMTDSRTIYGQQISNLIRQGYGKHLKVFDQTIPRSVRAAEISTTGKSIYQHDPKGKVAEAYHSIAKEVVADVEKRLNVRLFVLRHPVQRRNTGVRPDHLHRRGQRYSGCGGGLYLPNLTVAAPAEHPTGRWGRLHKMYLKEQHPIRYNQLLLSGELGGYLAKLDKQTEEQLVFI